MRKTKNIGKSAKSKTNYRSLMTNDNLSSSDFLRKKERKLHINSRTTQLRDKLFAESRSVLHTPKSAGRTIINNAILPMHRKVIGTLGDKGKPTKQITNGAHINTRYIIGTLEDKPSLTHAVKIIVERNKINVEELYKYGEEVFEDRDKFNDWLDLPNPILNNKKPIELLSSKDGIIEIKNELGRIEHGIY